MKKAAIPAGIEFFVGISDGRAGLSGVSELFCQARAALLNTETEGRRITEYKDIGIDKLICAAGSQALQSFVSQKVGAITRYDEKNGTEFSKLLRYYIENNGSISSIAQQLGVHRNTVNYQLGRIKELFALTLNETDRAELTLAFRILKLNEKGHLL